MFKWRKKGNAQARRKVKAQPSLSLRWNKSWNWSLLLLPLMLAGHFLAQMQQVLPVRSIQLHGSFDHLDQREVEATLQGYIGQGFFSLDILQLQQSLQDMAWTDSVSIRRIWPDKIRVAIREKKPVARWDENHLLSDSARVYPADSKQFAYLPLVHAANHSPAWVLRQFDRLQQRFAAVEEHLVSLRVDSRGAFDIELINGLQIKLGRDDIDHKIDRLASIYLRQILPRREQIERLDLRYSNGFAVAWKKAVLQANDKASIWSNSNV
jgi:cell division protein FtsQ